MNSQPQILTLFYEIGKNLRETEREAILFCLEVNIWVANQSARKALQYNFEVIFTALPGEYNISRRGRSAKSHFSGVVYHVLARYSILFDVHIWKLY